MLREGGQSTSRLVVLDGERLSVGSHPKNDLVLADPMVSRFHCVLERGDSAWKIVDSGSLNGTRLGGISVRDADLPAEAQIELGDSSFQIRELPAAQEIELLDQASFGEMFGQSRAMQRLFALMEKVSSSDANVLIEGESGTGKELVAGEIVGRGPRARKPFVVFDCGAIAPNLIESELFGHVKGSFTGADRDRAGAFETAHGGTIFLDEIGELPLEMQPKLLRVLETRTVRRVGESTPRRVDVRVLAATNRQLSREVNQGRFREDLFYRLSVVTISVPPLRARRDDVPLLIRAFLRSLGATREEAALFDDATMDRLQRYEWPGNVRELRNYVERCVVLRTTVPNDDRPDPVSTAAGGRDDEGPAPARVDLDVTFREAKERAIFTFERRYVEALMDWAGGNVSRAARRANMDRMNLYRILQRSGLRTFDD
ncbi:MAG: sigma 54-dependent Fis family transcriptional regulator [Labilithrix sp.]|nr:sigma 54-dependent Fis family transcriptional regulator [Labilithrix sp.]MCW5811837.1 sigma 54-dependent Fis family transcriptional regulator [Labilithrix sp.]